MAMNIKNQEAYDLARQLAREEGKSITQVVLEALRDRRQKIGQTARKREFEAALRELQGVLRNTPAEGPIRTVEDLYDPETGLPA